MSLANQVPYVESVYFNQDFIVMFESYIPLLRETARYIEVTVHQNMKFTGDFYGLLHDCSIPLQCHHLIGSFNNIRSSTDYKGDLDVILIPDLATIDNLKNIFLTKNF